MKKTKEIFTDLLIVGSGLAGTRAAFSARQADPDCNILMVSSDTGPSGSSFCNINNAIGIQVPETPEEKNAYIQCAEAIAFPGKTYPSLVKALMMDSPNVFNTLFTHMPEIAMMKGKTSGCFFKTHKTARILPDLHTARDSFNRQLTANKIDRLPHISLITVFKGRDGQMIQGALFKRTNAPGLVLIHCSAIILATGGFSPAIANALPGAYNLPTPIGMLADQGCKMINLPYLQYIWLFCDDQKVWPLWRPDNTSRIIDRDGNPIKCNDFGALMPQRASHVPGANGLPDARIDAWVMQHCARHGELTIIINGITRRIIPYVQACNGGLEINSHGETSLPGLFACGEAASGMHGANRIGGGMALACLVFGKRCGQAAIRHCRQRCKPTRTELNHVKNAAAAYADTFVKEDVCLRQEWLPKIQGLLFEALVLRRPFHGSSRQHFDVSRLSGDWFLRQTALTANTLLDALRAEGMGKTPNTRISNS